MLNVESKILFCIVAKRLSNFLLRHVSAEGRDTRNFWLPGTHRRGNLTHQGSETGQRGSGVLWLDCTNAYGLIPHKLVEAALERHQAPKKVKHLILDYDSKFCLTVHLEVAIVTGGTISVTLFALAMNMLIKAAEPECRGAISNSGVRQPPIKAMMYDITVTTTVPGARWIFQGVGVHQEVDTDELQTGKVQVPGHEEGESKRQLPLQPGRTSDTISH